MTKAIFAILSAAFFAFLWFGPQQKKPPVVTPLVAAPGQVVMTVNYTNSTPVLTDTPLSFTVAGNGIFTMACLLLWSSTDQSLDIGITGPASPVVVGYGFDHVRIGAQGYKDNAATAFGTRLGTNSVVVPNQKIVATVGMGLKVGAQAGTVTIQAAANQGTITIYPGSFCRMQ